MQLSTHAVALCTKLVTSATSVLSAVENNRQNVAALIGQLATDSVPYSEARELLKTHFIGLDSWPINEKTGEKVGENSARKSPAGKAFNSVAVSLAQGYHAGALGEIVKGKATKAPEESKEGESSEGVPLAVAASLGTLSVDEALLALLKACGGSKAKVLEAVATIPDDEEIVHVPTAKVADAKATGKGRHGKSRQATANA